MVLGGLPPPPRAFRGQLVLWWQELFWPLAPCGRAADEAAAVSLIQGLTFAMGRRMTYPHPQLAWGARWVGSFTSQVGPRPESLGNEG